MVMVVMMMIVTTVIMIMMLSMSMMMVTTMVSATGWTRESTPPKRLTAVLSYFCYSGYTIIYDNRIVSRVQRPSLWWGGGVTPPKLAKKKRKLGQNLVS